MAAPKATVAATPPRPNTSSGGRPISRATTSRGRTKTRACEAHAARPSSYARRARRSRRASVMGAMGVPPCGAESFHGALQALAEGRRARAVTGEDEVDGLRIVRPERAENL